MKKALFFAGLAAASLAFVGCNKEADFYGRNDRFEIVLNTEETRTAIDGMNTVWVNSDQINVFHALTGTTDYKHDTAYDGEKQHPFKVADAETGLFTGELLGGELVEGQSYDWYLFYPYNSYLQSPVNTADGRNYIGCAGNQVQRQDGNDNMDHLAGGVNTGSFPLYGIATNVPAGTRPQVTMKHIASAIAVKVTNVSDDPVSIVNIKFTAPEAVVGNYYISFEKTPVTLTPYQDQQSNTVTLQVQNGEDIPAGGSATFYMGIKPFTAASGSELTLEVTGTNGVVTATKTLTAAAVFTAGKIKTLNIDYDKNHVESEYEWVKTTLDKVTETDEFVFVGHNADGDWAMANDKGADAAPTAIAVEDVDGKLKNEPTADIIWTLTKGSTAGQFAFSPKGASTFLYTTNTNNGVRVGTNDNHFFTLDAGYLKNVATSRYVGIYTSQDWRCYTSINNNIKDQSFAPYVKYKKGSVTPEKVFTAVLVGAEGDGQSLLVPAATTTASIAITADADIAWTAEASTGLTLSATEGTGSKTLTAEFPANTATTEKEYSVMVRSSAEGIGNDEWALVITQEGVSTEIKTYPYEEAFNEGAGAFQIDNVNIDEHLTYVWSFDTRYKYMKASAYKDNTNYPSESWLVSPVVDMASAVSPQLSFSHVISKFFGNVSTEATVWIKQEGGSWNQLTISYPDFPEGKNFSDWGEVKVDVSSYAGKKVQVGFKYTSTSSASGTWEVKDFKLKEATSGPVDPEVTVPATLSVEKGKTKAITVTTNSDGAKTWSTSDATVATVADGVVTGVKVGTATITLAIAATENFNAAQKTIAVTVTEPEGTEYGKVNTITSGKKYLIVSGGKSADNYYAMVPPTSTTAGRPAGAVVTVSDKKIASTATTDAYAVTLTKSGDDVSIVLSDGSYLIYAGSQTNLKVSETATDFWNVTPGMYGNFRLAVKSVNTRSLVFRGGDSNCFGGYMSNNVNGTEYFDVDLYELGAEPTPDPVLVSIAVSNQKTEFYVNDEFSFGGVVTATYDSGPTKDVTSKAPSSSPDMTSVGTKAVTVTYTEGEVTKTISYNIVVKEAPTTGTQLTFVFSEKSSETGTDQWPTGSSEAASTQTYTLNSTDYTFALGKDTYMGTSSGKVFLMVKNGSYLGLPAIAGKKLVKVAYTTSSGASTGTYGAICTDAAGTTPVTGGAALALNQLSTEFSWTLSGTAANTMYYFVASKKNSQAVQIVLTYE